MDRLAFWATSRPITAGLIIFLLLLMCSLLFARRKDAAHLTMARADCSPKLRLERDIFNSAKWLIILLALVGLFIKF
jgi:4-amino-4-deoxy-L-arabinose transferase-like glycosyltransferase